MTERFRAGCAHQRGWVLLVLLLGTLALGVTGFHPKTPSAKAVPKPPPIAPAWGQQTLQQGPASSLQIVAHPDDDLFFMNPDLAQTIRSGAPTTTVYVTAGESNGKNIRKDWGHLALTDKPGYVTARHNGLRRAYSQMATGRTGAKWDTATLETPAGPVEMISLAEQPQVKLVFLDVAQNDLLGKATLLRGLVRGSVSEVHTILGRGGPVAENRRYTRDKLIATLVALIKQARPSVVRTQDPDPERGRDRNGADGRADHPDHTATALLTRQALDRYESEVTTPLVVEAYRGYYNRYWPHNLSAAAAAEKIKLISTYGWADKGSFKCHMRWGCGDLRVSGSSGKGGWPQSTHHRYAGSTRWLVRQPDGRLAAYAVVSGKVFRWEERVPGGEWHPGVAMSEPGFTPDLSIVRLADGRSALLGVRIPAVSPGAAAAHKVMMAVQDRPSGEFAAWADLGNPAADGSDRQRDVGAPTAAIDGTGRITVFARDSEQGVSAREQRPDGTFGPWASIGGQRVQDGIAAATDRSGRIQLFAAAKPPHWKWKKADPSPGLLRWRQKAPGGPIDRPVWMVPSPVVTGPLTLTKDPAGVLTLLARRPGTAEAAAFHQNPATGAWPTQPTVLGGPGGFGPIGAVAPAPGVLGLAVRNEQGTVGIFETGAWLDSGGLFVQSPGIAVDARGQLAVAVLGVDGRLHLARRGPDSSWRWQSIS